MLKKIRLKDFKSFVDEEVELAPLTLLVGANASGKSNFLDALRFLQGLSLILLRIRTESMRGYGRRKAPLGDEGKNISGVLADICSEPEAKQSLVAWLTEICAPELEDIDFVEVRELGDVMAIFVEKGGKRISARSISDGTLHFLGTLLALRTAEPGSVVLIEEVEHGLHPTRIGLLVEYLEAVTRERDIQIIATTHSPVVLEWLSDEALRNVVVFGRVPEHEGTLMRRLRDLPHFDEAVARAGIEELFTTGWLEMAL
jgi:predicted ATPase